jgi:4-amino-4-deoxy-L-arabinose transferase-like glycosyltransferase
MGHIYNVGEAREGEVIQELFKSDRFILPLRNGELVPSKPILFHWIAAGLIKVLHGPTSVDLFSLRLTSGLAGILTVITVFFMTRVAGGNRAALLAALLCLTTQGFVATAWEGRVDCLFNSLVTLTVAIWLIAAIKHRNDDPSSIPSWVFHASAITCGLAALTKGPLAFVHTGSIIGAIAYSQWRTRGLVSLIRWQWIWALLIPLPWYIAAVFQGGDGFVSRQFIYENLRRFSGGAGISKRPFGFYIPALFSHCGPWSVPFFIMLASFIRLKERRVFSEKDSATWFAIRAGILWFVIPFVFLNIAAGKHFAYLSPLLPGMCMAVAVWCTHVVSWPATSKILEKLLPVIVGVAVVLAPIVIAFAPSLALLNKGASLAFLSIPEALDGYGALFMVLHTLFGGLAIYLVFTRSQRRGVFNQYAPPLIMAALVLICIDQRLARAIRGVTHSYNEFAATLSRHVSPDTRVNLVLATGTDKLLGVGRDDSFDPILYYMNRHFTMRSNEEVWTEPGLYLARRSWIERQSPEWRSLPREILEGGKRSDRGPDRLVLFEIASPRSPENG